MVERLPTRKAVRSAGKKEAKPKAATFTWVDAQLLKGLSGTLEEILPKAKLATRESVGYILHWDEDLFITAGDYDASDQTETGKAEWGIVTVYPSRWVVKVKIAGRLVTKEGFNAKESERPRVAEVPEHPVTPS